jgi:prepilin-type N-terminal cleavage/methylation domain-containing protein
MLKKRACFLKSQRGFTLIELAIVLIVLGFIIGSGMDLLGMFNDRSRMAEGKEVVSSNVLAVEGYVLKYKKLPDTTNFSKVASALYDPFGKPLVYVYDANLATNNICNATGSLITIRLCNDAACSSYTDIQNVAFMILSGGLNHNIQTGVPTSGAVSSATTIKVYKQGLKNIDDYSADVNRREMYDDIVKWVSFYELVSLLSCSS